MTSPRRTAFFIWGIIPFLGVFSVRQKPNVIDLHWGWFIGLGFPRSLVFSIALRDEPCMVLEAISCFFKVCFSLFFLLHLLLWTLRDSHAGHAQWFPGAPGGPGGLELHHDLVGPQVTMVVSILKWSSDLDDLGYPYIRKPPHMWEHLNDQRGHGWFSTIHGFVQTWRIVIECADAQKQIFS